MKRSSRKVVITGGAGFIGSHLASALSECAQVVVVDNLSSGKKANLSGLPVRLIEGDIGDVSLLARSFRGASCIFHQAALVSVPLSVTDPLSAHRNNLTGTLNVLLAARDAGVKKVVFASSAAVYGDLPPPLHEQLPVRPQSPYGVTKAGGEQYCRVFSELYGVKSVVLRYFNVYGPRQDPFSNYAGVITRFIERVRNGRPPIIYGDGSQTRDFVFVQDIIRANILAMENDVEGIFNIARGEPTRVKELALHILTILGSDLNPIHESPRPGDIQDSYADISRAGRDLSYHPSWDLKKGLEETTDWFIRGRGTSPAPSTAR
jgi:UDP-glucose 4-epimerase